VDCPRRRTAARHHALLGWTPLGNAYRNWHLRLQGAAQPNQPWIGSHDLSQRFRQSRVHPRRSTLNRRDAPPNKAMKLTELSPAPLRGRSAGSCPRWTISDAGTAPQLIARQERPARLRWAVQRSQRMPFELALSTNITYSSRRSSRAAATRSVPSEKLTMRVTPSIFVPGCRLTKRCT
jgi:hypothetical protein